MTGFGWIGQVLDGLVTSLFGSVLRVDRFGNLVTNISAEDFSVQPVRPRLSRSVSEGGRFGDCADPTQKLPTVTPS